jgi:hypothetical protein
VRIRFYAIRFYANNATLFAAMGWFSGSWRVQVRRKEKDVNDTFLWLKDAEEWRLKSSGALIERAVSRKELPRLEV